MRWECLVKERKRRVSKEKSVSLGLSVVSAIARYDCLSDITEIYELPFYYHEKVFCPIFGMR